MNLLPTETREAAEMFLSQTVRTKGRGAYLSIGLTGGLFSEDDMKGFVDNIEALTVGSDAFRKVLYTGKHLQLVLMTLQPGEEIGAEVHETHDQFFRIEEGAGEVEIDGVKSAIKDDDAIIVPAGARHNVVNTGDTPLRLYTLYGPPEHRDGVVHATKADESEEHFDGRTTE